MPDILISMKKKSDGTAVLSCTRSDGSTTWQLFDRRLARFFPFHDLTHYAVETELGHRRGFYGLIADGWDFTDFGSPWPRGPIPADADPAELIVGLLDAERADGRQWSAAELNDYAASLLAQAGATHVSLLDDAKLSRIHARMQGLFAQWLDLPLGQTLRLDLSFGHIISKYKK